MLCCVARSPPLRHALQCMDSVTNNLRLNGNASATMRNVVYPSAPSGEGNEVLTWLGYCQCARDVFTLSFLKDLDLLRKVARVRHAGLTGGEWDGQFSIGNPGLFFSVDWATGR